MTSHLFTAKMEPATRYDLGAPSGKRMIVHHGQRQLISAICCGKRRQARNLWVQVFYDDVRFWCRKGKGCKA